MTPGSFGERNGARLCGALCLLMLFPGSASAQPAPQPALWKLDIRDRVDSTAAVAPDGTIYFGSFLGRLWALTPEGRQKWTFRAGREIHSSPAIGPDGTVYFGSRDRSLYAVDPAGKKKWSFRTGAWVDSSPAIDSDGTVYFGSWDKQFYALDSGGKRKWAFSTGGEIVSSPAISLQGRIHFGSHDGKLYALERSGAKAWDFKTSGAILSSPALDREGGSYFTSVDGHIYALNAQGALKWKVQTGGITESSPVLGEDGTVYVGANKILWAITPEGKEKWQQPATMDNYQQPIRATPAALADGSTVIISGYGLVINLDTEHHGRWAHFFGEYGGASPALAAAGTVYMAGYVTNFAAISNSVPLAKSPWPKFRGDRANTGNVQRQR